MKKLLTVSIAAFLIGCNNNNEEAPINNCQSKIDEIRQANGAGTYYIEVKKVTFSGEVVVYNDTATVN